MDNLRGSLFMILAMALFAIEDMLIKQMSVSLPTGQIIAVIGAGGIAAFVALAWARSEALWTPLLWHPTVWARAGCELVGTLGYVTALSLIDISLASAILQSVPLLVTLGAALFLGETVGWRRWTAIGVGLIGVMLIIQPGLDGFEMASLFAVQGAIFLALRDLVTRTAPAGVTSAHFSVSAFAALVIAGVALMVFRDQAYVVPDALNWGRLAAAVVIGVLAYLAIITGSRTGEVAVVAPFRYSRIVFALIVGYLVFDESPNALMLIGTVIVVGSGLYSLIRKARLKRATSIT